MNYRKKNYQHHYCIDVCTLYYLYPFEEQSDIIKSWYLCEDELTWSICLPYF